MFFKNVNIVTSSLHLRELLLYILFSFIYVNDQCQKSRKSEHTQSFSSFQVLEQQIYECHRKLDDDKTRFILTAHKQFFVKRVLISFQLCSLKKILFVLTIIFKRKIKENENSWHFNVCKQKIICELV